MRWLLHEIDAECLECHSVSRQRSERRLDSSWVLRAHVVDEPVVLSTSHLPAPDHQRRTSREIQKYRMT
jgi:hypothetical protein